MSHVAAPSEERIGCGLETRQERRRRERLRVCLPVYVRRLDHSQPEVTTTVDFTRHGLRFNSSKDHYFPGMPLLVTFPYSGLNFVRTEYFGEIVRVDQVNGGKAVAVKFHLSR